MKGQALPLSGSATIHVCLVLSTNYPGETTDGAQDGAQETTDGAQTVLCTNWWTEPEGNTAQNCPKHPLVPEHWKWEKLKTTGKAGLDRENP